MGNILNRGRLAGPPVNVDIGEDGVANDSPGTLLVCIEEIGVGKFMPARGKPRGGGIGFPDCSGIFQATPEAPTKMGIIVPLISVVTVVGAVIDEKPA